jgi:amino acid adenylation domain-containing protein
LSAITLWSKLKSLGIDVSAAAGQLRVRARPGVITPELQSEIAQSKEALLAVLAALPTETGLVRVTRNGNLPLSYFQERLWVIQRLDPESTAFNMAAMWLSARHTTAQERVTQLRAVVGKHEVLRCVVDEESETPVARPLAPDAVVMDVVDVTNLSESELSERLVQARADATRRPFDLAGEAPVRFTVFDAGGRVVTLMAAHHIAIDAWSATLLRREIEAEAETFGAESADRYQYADYAAWQRRMHETTDFAASLEWWAERLARIPQLSAVPADHAPSEQGVGAVSTFSWDRQLAEGVRALAQANGATLYMALVAACAAVLGRHAHQDDIVLGSPMGVRELSALETMVGPFVNLLVLRLDISDDPTFTELLLRAKTAVLDAHEHRHTSFEKLVERLKPARDLNRSPIFQTAVVLHNAAQDEDLDIHGGGAIHDMTWFVRETTDGIAGSLEYRSDIYAAETAARVVRHLELLLRSAVAGPKLPVSRLALTTSDERRALITAGQSKPATVDLTPFPRQFERQVARTPTKCAAVFGDASLTYDELNRRANRMARQLLSHGAGKGACVGVLLERGLDLLVVLLAIQKCGAAYLPLDPKHPAERRAYMLQDSGCTLLVVDAATADSAQSSTVRLVDIEANAASIAGFEDTDLPYAPDAGDPVYLIYTSGSTGRPKGVAISHRNLSNFLASMAKEPGLSPDDVLAAVTTISFDIAGLELYLPLLVGARIEMIDQETATDGELLKLRLQQSGATIMQATPTTWRQLVEAGWSGGAGFRALCGGESLPRDLANEVLSRVGTLWNMYGPTETTIWSSITRVESGVEPICIGRPIDNTDIHILDRHGEPVPAGLPGEIFIGGEGVAIGYHARPELTAERFVADRLSGRPGARLYATGDLGKRMNDGRYVHLGRLDAQVKIRGMRIELGEIEAALGAIPEIQNGIVVAREAVPGEGRLVAYVVYRPGQDLTVSEVRRYLRKTLPDHMVPSVVVMLDTVPLTPNGKIDRQALPDPFISSGRSSDTEPPSPGIEQQMAEIWNEYLQVESIGANDNFFELGGQSLLALRVAAAVERNMGRRMDPRSLFFQTLRQVSAHVASAPVSARRSAQ